MANRRSDASHETVVLMLRVIMKNWRSDLPPRERDNIFNALAALARHHVDDPSHWHDMEALYMLAQRSFLFTDGQNQALWQVLLRIRGIIDDYYRQD